MNGIERITQRIDADAQAKIDQMMAAARENAAQITARYQAQADQERAERTARNEKNAALHEERLVSVAELEARKANLADRQAMVEKAFELALRKLCALPDAAYTEVVAKLLAQAAPDGKGSVVFAQAEHDRIGTAAVAAANQMLGKRGALTLSDEVRPLRGGFILVNGNIEVNCNFETLIRLEKSKMAGEVARILFPHD
jgi:V/A-type H+-transporting ATPase subunit E